MDWLEVTVRTNTAGADLVSEWLMQTGASGTSIEDRNDALLEPVDATKWDIIDDAVIEAMDEDVLVRGYLPRDERVTDRIATLRGILAGATQEMLGFDAGPLSLETEDVREEDWSENWKKYYKPFRVGEHLLVKPVWEEVEAGEGDRIIELDPGMAFGNGTHETTFMCLGLIEKLTGQGCTVLDVGTGSGILGIAAALQGASKVVAVDIDPVAVKVARENIERNHVENVVTARVGDMLKGLDEKADVVVANIIADVVIMLTSAVRNHLNEGGAFVCSGIIRDREQDVLDALKEHGFTVETIEHKGEWVAILAR